MKTKALISCVVTAQLICIFVFAYANSRFSLDVAHIVLLVDSADKDSISLLTLAATFAHVVIDLLG